MTDPKNLPNKPILQLRRHNDAYTVTLNPVDKDNKVKPPVCVTISASVEQQQLSKVKEILLYNGFRYCKCGRSIARCECRNQNELNKLLSFVKQIERKFKIHNIINRLCFEKSKDLFLEFTPANIVESMFHEGPNERLEIVRRPDVDLQNKYQNDSTSHSQHMKDNFTAFNEMSRTKDQTTSNCRPMKDNFTTDDRGVQDDATSYSRYTNESSYYRKERHDDSTSFSRRLQTDSQHKKSYVGKPKERLLTQDDGTSISKRAKDEHHNSTSTSHRMLSDSQRKNTSLKNKNKTILSQDDTTSFSTHSIERKTSNSRMKECYDSTSVSTHIRNELKSKNDYRGNTHQNKECDLPDDINILFDSFSMPNNHQTSPNSNMCGIVDPNAKISNTQYSSPSGTKPNSKNSGRSCEGNSKVQVGQPSTKSLVSSRASSKQSENSRIIEGMPIESKKESLRKLIEKDLRDHSIGVRTNRILDIEFDDNPQKTDSKHSSKKKTPVVMKSDNSGPEIEINYQIEGNLPKDHQELINFDIRMEECKCVNQESSPNDLLSRESSMKKQEKMNTNPAKSEFTNSDIKSKNQYTFRKNDQPLSKDSSNTSKSQSNGNTIKAVYNAKGVLQDNQLLSKVDIIVDGCTCAGPTSDRPQGDNQNTKNVQQPKTLPGEKREAIGSSSSRNANQSTHRDSLESTQPREDVNLKPSIGSKRKSNDNVHSSLRKINSNQNERNKADSTRSNDKNQSSHQIYLNNLCNDRNNKCSKPSKMLAISSSSFGKVPNKVGKVNSKNRSRSLSKSLNKEESQPNRSQPICTNSSKCNYPEHVDSPNTQISHPQANKQSSKSLLNIPSKNTSKMSRRYETNTQDTSIRRTSSVSRFHEDETEMQDLSYHGSHQSMLKSVKSNVTYRDPIQSGSKPDTSKPKHNRPHIPRRSNVSHTGSQYNANDYKHLQEKYRKAMRSRRRKLNPSGSCSEDSSYDEDGNRKIKSYDEDGKRKSRNYDKDGKQKSNSFDEDGNLNSKMDNTKGKKDGSKESSYDDGVGVMKGRRISKRGRRTKKGKDSNNL